MSSTLVAPYLISEPFGFAAANPTYINLPIPVPSQISITINAASFTDGFPPNTMTPEASGGLPFFGQDMNGILYMITAYCANFAAGALSVYNSTLSSDISGYPVGAVLVDASGTGLWISTVNGNTTDPDTSGAGWNLLASSGGTSVAVTTGTVTLTAAQYTAPFINFTGTLTGNVTVVLPTLKGANWVVANSTTGAHTLQVQTSGGTPITVPQTGSSAPTSIYCDGTNIQNTGVSTAGLAPINSPALTGTPTAPTATPATTNTTQIATTAFTQAAITAALGIYAKLASPIFSGTPTAPTASPGTNTLQLASTAFVTAAITAAGATVSLSGTQYTITFTGGIIIKIGYATLGASSPSTMTFNVPFPSICYGGVAMCRTSYGELDLASYNTAGMTFNFGASSQPINFIAIGK